VGREEQFSMSVETILFLGDKIWFPRPRFDFLLLASHTSAMHFYLPQNRIHLLALYLLPWKAILHAKHVVVTRRSSFQSKLVPIMIYTPSNAIIPNVEHSHSSVYHVYPNLLTRQKRVRIGMPETLMLVVLGKPKNHKLMVVETCHTIIIQEAEARTTS
jgi:hypothetical protein